MSAKKYQCCAVPECMQCFEVEKRHFFRFPKEHNRWLQWIRACKRPDLESKGPEYAYHNCRICHLHFEEKWYNISKIRAHLHPDAIPTRFFGAPFNDNAVVSTMATIMLEEDNTSTTNNTVQIELNCQQEKEQNIEMKQEKTNENIYAEATQSLQGVNINEDVIKSTSVQERNDNRDTSNKTSKSTRISTENNSQERKLRMKIIKLKAQNKTLRETIRRLRKNKQKKRTGTTLKEETNDYDALRELGRKLLPANFAKLLFAQIDTQTKSKQGRRYDPEFKKFALTLYFLSPRNYKELKKSIALPSVRLLQLFTETWDIMPGINNKIFDNLTVKLNSLPPIERHCILCADEMSLKAHLFYNVSRDEIIGFEDTGNNKSSVPAKSALVIMARSIAGNWKIPVCFCFVETTCSSKVVKNIIFDIIIKLKNNGIKVHALVTDMGSNFVMLSRELGISTENSIFLVEEEKIVYIFDTPHLIKATRNNLLKHNFQINNKIASWAHIVDFYKRDKNSG